MTPQEASLLLQALTRLVLLFPVPDEMDGDGSARWRVQSELNTIQKVISDIQEQLTKRIRE